MASAAEDTPTGICQVWNGKEFVTQKCSDESGSRKRRPPEPRGPSAEEEAHDLDRVGAHLYNAGKLEEAAGTFERAKNTYAYDGAAYYGLCLVNEAWSNYALALSYCMSALQYGTGGVWSTSRSQLAEQVESLRRRTDQQREADNRASDESNFQNCREQYDAMDWERALYHLDYYVKDQRVMRHRQEAYAMRGTALTRLGRFQEAEQALHQAYVLDPQKALAEIEAGKHPNLADNLWDLEVSRGLAITGTDIDSTLRKLSLYQQSLRFRPDDFRSLYWLAYAEFKAGRWREGAAHLEAAQQHFIDNCGASCPCVGPSCPQDDSPQPAPLLIDKRPVPSSPTIGEPQPTRMPGFAAPFWHPPDVRSDLEGAQRIALLAKEDLRTALEAQAAGDSSEKVRAELAEDCRYLGEFEKAHALYEGLLSSFPDNKDYRHYKEILSRLIVHEPIYTREARLQAEYAKLNGMEAVKRAVDQNMRCVAGQPFDGNGTCIANGFTWP